MRASRSIALALAALGIAAATVGAVSVPVMTTTVGVELLLRGDLLIGLVLFASGLIVGYLQLRFGVAVVRGIRRNSTPETRFVAMTDALAAYSLGSVGLMLLLALAPLPRTPGGRYCRLASRRLTASGSVYSWPAGRAALTPPRLALPISPTRPRHVTARETAPPLSCNISQNYPYASETEVARRAVVADIFSRFDGLAAKIQAETTPLDAPRTHRRWRADALVGWVCPKGDFAGRLHVAGYAIEKHALYTVCDTHGDTYLR